MNIKEILENKASIYESSIRIKATYTKEDIKRIKKNFLHREGKVEQQVGEEYSFIPITINEKEAFERLVYMTAQKRSEYFQSIFCKKYPKINLDVINSEIGIIEKFITSTKEDNTKISLAMSSPSKQPKGVRFKDEELILEYLRINNHFYDVNLVDYNDNSITCEVYGRYILYYKWLLNLRKSRKPISSEIPETFEELFINPSDAEICLDILRKLNPPSIDAEGKYIGKSKGIFPLWINVLKNHNPKSLIKHCSELVYKDLLNTQVYGLELSKDASEFRKTYKRLELNNIKLEIKAILSQLSQDGRLGK